MYLKPFQHLMRHFVVLLALCVVSALSFTGKHPAHGATFQWDGSLVPSGFNGWSGFSPITNDSNWLDTISSPGSGDTAILGPVSPASLRSVEATDDGATFLVFDSPDSYEIFGGDLQLENVTVLQGSHLISATTEALTDGTWDIATDATLTLSGSLSPELLPKELIRRGGGTLRFEGNTSRIDLLDANEGLTELDGATVNLFRTSGISMDLSSDAILNLVNSSTLNLDATSVELGNNAMLTVDGTSAVNSTSGSIQLVSDSKIVLNDGAQFNAEASAIRLDNNSEIEINTGSTLSTTTGQITVGVAQNFEQATKLSISGGGRIDSTSGLILVDNIGTLEVTGTGSAAATGGDVIVDNASRMFIRDGASLSANNLTISGNFNDAVAEITGGAQVTVDNRLQLGDSTNQDGTLTVDGLGTFLFTDELWLSGENNNGEGSIIINNSAAVVADSIRAGNIQSRIEVNGGVLFVEELVSVSDTAIGIADGPLGTALVIGAPGAADSSWTGRIIDLPPGNVPGSLRKQGTSNLTLSGNSSYSGGTTITGGTIFANLSTAIGTGAVDISNILEGSAGLIVGQATVNLGNPINVTAMSGGGVTIGTRDFVAAQSTLFTGPISITKDGGEVLTLQAGSTGGTTFSGEISGDGGLRITSPFGPGRKVILDRAAGQFNTFSGDITIDDDAVLQIGTGSAFGITIPQSAALSFNNAGSSLDISSGGSNGLMFVKGLHSTAPGAGQIDLITGDAYRFFTDLDDGQSSEFSGTITETSGVLTLINRGAGTQVLSGSNSYSGGTQITAGTVVAKNNAALGTSGVLINSPANGNDKALLIGAGGVTISNPIEVNTFNFSEKVLGSSDISTASNAEFAGPITLQATSAPGELTLQGGSTGGTVFSGAISGAGGIRVISPFGANRRVVLNRPSGAANSFTGDVTIDNDATLQIGDENSIGNRAIPDMADLHFNSAGSTFALAPTGTGDSETIGALVSSAPGDGVVDLVTGADFTLLVGGGDASGAFGGTISNSDGSLTLEKIGAGTQTLSGNNTYDGETQVQAGTLLVNNTSGSGTGSAAVDVFNGATLGGTGSVAGTVSIVNGATLAPGMSTGAFSIGGNLDVSNGASLAIELGGTIAGDEYDRVEVTGFADLLGDLDVTLIDSFTPSAGDSFAFLFASGGFNAAFANLNLPDLSADGLEWLLNPGGSTLFLQVVAPTVDGDYDGDGDVDGADFLRWQREDGTPEGLADWQNGYGGGQPIALASLPEPTSLAIVLVAAVCFQSMRSAGRLGSR